MLCVISDCGRNWTYIGSVPVCVELILCHLPDIPLVKYIEWSQSLPFFPATCLNTIFFTLIQEIC